MDYSAALILILISLFSLLLGRRLPLCLLHCHLLFISCLPPLHHLPLTLFSFSSFSFFVMNVILCPLLFFPPTFPSTLPLFLWDCMQEMTHIPALELQEPQRMPPLKRNATKDRVKKVPICSRTCYCVVGKNEW